jgi:hypothetical protein
MGVWDGARRGPKMTSVGRCWGLAKGAAGQGCCWLTQTCAKPACVVWRPSGPSCYHYDRRVVHSIESYLQFGYLSTICVILYHCDSSQQQDQHSSIGVQAACSGNQDNDMQVTIQTTQLVVTLKFTKQKFKPYLSSDAEKDLHSPAINGGSVVPEHFRYVFYDTNEYEYV